MVVQHPNARRLERGAQPFGERLVFARPFGGHGVVVIAEHRVGRDARFCKGLNKGNSFAYLGAWVSTRVVDEVACNQD